MDNIYITKIEVVKIPEEKCTRPYIEQLCENEDTENYLPIYEGDFSQREITCILEIINGHICVDPDGDDIRIGMSKEVKEKIGVLFEMLKSNAQKIHKLRQKNKEYKYEIKRLISLIRHCDIPKAIKKVSKKAIACLKILDSSRK